MQHKRSHRIVFYLNDAEVERLDEAVATSDLERAAYLRQVLLGPSDSTDVDAPAHVRVLEEALADARQSKDRLEQLLLQSQTTVQNLTRALPAAGETSRPWWKVW